MQDTQRPSEEPEPELRVVNIENPRESGLADDAAQTAGFMQTLSQAEASGTCVRCGSSHMNRQDFRDTVSWDESHISFLCQDCQDVVFGELGLMAGGEEQSCFDGEPCDWPGGDCNTCPWMGGS